MKQTLITLSLVCLSLFINAQTTYGSRISYVSEKKDTLILPDNSLGKTIAMTWINVKSEKKPVILYADEATITRKNKYQLASVTRKDWLKDGK